MNTFARKFLGTGLLLGLAAAGLSAQPAMNPASLPLRFEAGQKQTDGAANFVARGANAEFHIAPNQTTFILRQSAGKTASCTMQFVGANAAARIAGGAELAGKINYLVGCDPAGWRTGVPTFAQVRVGEIYPGVSLVYYGNGRELEYDFNLAAGTDPQQIILRFNGAEKISVNPQGDLIIGLNGGKVVQHAPVAYQKIGDTRRAIASAYKIVDAHTATFALGDYDRNQPLVIDPVLGYSTYFGGNYGEIAHAVAIDASGNVYVAGETLSTAFSNNVPLATSGAFQTNFHGGTLTGDAFVAKFDNTGSNLLYLTYLGGGSDDAAYALALDNLGNAYVTGLTRSSDFPTNNALYGYKTSFAPGYGLAFVAELNTNGSKLIYSTYLSGYVADSGYAIAVDAAQNAYVAGYTVAPGFPVTTNALQTKLACTNTVYFNRNAFVAEIAPGGTNLAYCSYLGGTNYDQATGIALDPAGNVYVSGYTASTNFPATNAIAGFKYLNGASNATPALDAFVCKFNPNFAGLSYSTLLGGTNNDAANAIAADAGGNAYVVGWTCSTNFPNTTNTLTAFGTNSGSFVRTNLTGYVIATNAFLTQIQWNGTNAAIGYSVMFGGFGNDAATSVALSPVGDGNVFVTGHASSTNFPVAGITANTRFLQTTNSGLSDAFVIGFTNNAAQVLYSAYLGGADNDAAYGIAVDPLDAVYVVGQTLSTNFPTLNARQNFRNGTNDAFLAKIFLNGASPVLTISPTNSGAQLAWQMFPPVYNLESNTNLQSTNWNPVLPPPTVISNAWYGLTLPATNAVEFFRLRHQ
jgi:hypothetical protein